jgi:flagellar basal body L-ring protein FlgH
MYKKLPHSFIILVILLTCGCSKFFADLRSGLGTSGAMADASEENPENASDSQAKSPFKNGKRATRDDFIDQSQEEGSLWASSGQTNYYFTKNKVRSPGDIVTVKVENDLYRAITEEIKKSLSPDEKTVELIEAKEHLRDRLVQNMIIPGKDQLTTTAAAPERAPGSADPAALSSGGALVSGAAGAKSTPSLTAAEIEKQVMQLSTSELDISPSLEIKNGDMMMGEIVGRYPNGNYKIRTTKKVLYKKGQAREVNVLAIVKASDIGEDTDAVNSGKLYDYQVEVAH